MQYHKQLFRHDPENGFVGDCFRTALACLLDLKPEDAPHFMGNLKEPIEDAWANVDTWLDREHGLRFCIIPFKIEEDLETCLEGFFKISPGLRLEVGGFSPRGTPHSVIVEDGKVVHDPHPDGGGIVAPFEDGTYSIGFLLPTAIHGKRTSEYQLRQARAIEETEDRREEMEP